jgi:hypothetical protein
MKMRLTGLGVAAAIVVLVVAQLAVWVRHAGSAAATSTNRLVTVRSGYDSTTQKSVLAVCPTGKRVLGGGGRVVDGDGFVALVELLPASTYGFDWFRAAAREMPGGYAGVWEVQAYAVCGDALPRLQRVTATSDAPPGATVHDTTVNCPVGTKVIGLGGGVAEAGVTFQSVRPYDNGGYGSVVVSGVHDATTPRPLAFRVTAHAICAEPGPGYAIVGTGTLAGSGRFLQTSIRCGQQRRVFGVGVTKVNPQGTSHVDAVFPADFVGTGTGAFPSGAGGPGPEIVWVGTRQPNPPNPVTLAAWGVCAD